MSNLDNNVRDENCSNNNDNANINESTVNLNQSENDIELEDERNFDASIQNDINNERINQQQQQIQEDVDVDRFFDAQGDSNQNNEGNLDHDNNNQIVNDDDDDDQYEDIEDDDDDEEDDDDEYDDDDDDDDDDIMHNEEFDALVDSMQEISDHDDYENVKKPNQINFDTALPASHNYLGQNFEDISSSKVVHIDNDVLTIPIIALPGAQLLPGQTMPLCIYSTAQISMIKKRLDDSSGDPTIGIIIRPELETSNEMIGTLAEIISSKNEENDRNSATMGLLLKVKGRERFKVLKIKRDITGCALADIRIMPEYVLTQNPLQKFAPRNTDCTYDLFFRKNFSFNDTKSKIQKSKTSINSTILNKKCSLAKAELLNTTNHPAWLYRQYDCNFMIDLIIKQLNESYDESQMPPLQTIPKDPIMFSNWLLNNFPFDDQLRLNILKLDCINQRLRYIYSVFKHYSSINCRLCRAQICRKSDIFSMCIQGFMSAYVNPAGHIHETLTVYKAKNLSLIGRSSTEFSWFPGYAWTICQCKQCGSHIGWKFTATKPDMIPDKFWGLTRRAVCNTNDSIDKVQHDNITETTTALNRTNSQASEPDNWLPVI